MTVNLRFLTAGSDHDGEVLAAARHAERLRKESGLTWYDIVRDRPIHDPTPPPNLDFKTAAICLSFPKLLTAWERGFLQSIIDKDYPLTEKQRNVLRRIVQKVKAAQGWT
jgi:hypothetical protein